MPAGGGSQFRHALQYRAGQWRSIDDPKTHMPGEWRARQRGRWRGPGVGVEVC